MTLQILSVRRPGQGCGDFLINGGTCGHLIPVLALHGGPPAVAIAPPHVRWPMIGEDEEEAVLAQLRRGVVSVQRRADVVAELEDALARWLDVPHVMTTSSGTAALHAAFFALDLPAGSEVLAPAYTHLASVLPMLHVGLVPRLCDVDPATGNLDVADAARRITPRTRAIVVTHQYGQICDMAAICELARRHRLAVVEDASHAHGATRGGRLAGTFGDIACFSLQAHKAIAAGEGGFLVTRDPRRFERAALLGHFRERTAATSDALAPLVETGYGLKLRIHPLAAALALVGLRKLPAVIAGRRANLAYFTERLAGVVGVAPLPTAAGVDRGGWFRFLVHYTLPRVPIDRYIAALRAEGVAEVLPGSAAKPLHLTALLQSGWGGAPVYRSGDFPAAERFSAGTLQFPAFTEPSEQIIDAYVGALHKVAHHAEALV